MRSEIKKNSRQYLDLLEHDDCSFDDCSLDDSAVNHFDSVIAITCLERVRGIFAGTELLETRHVGRPRASIFASSLVWDRRVK